MKKLFPLALLLICLIHAQAQEFNFKMYIEDAAGNTDSIELGYDPNASNGIDSIFGEKDIKDIPFSLPLDVRLCNPFYVGHSFTGWIEDDPSNFQTKRQILPIEDCSSLIAQQTIVMRTENWPIKIKWPKALFDDNCRSKSLINHLNFSFWFDLGTEYSNGIPAFESNIFLAEQDSILIDQIPYYDQYIDKPTDYYFDENLNDIRVLYFSFYSEESVGINAKNPGIKKEIAIYPNPCSNNICIDISGTHTSAITNCHIYNNAGQLLLVKNNINNHSIMDISGLSNGLYLIRVFNNNTVYEEKILIQN